MRIELHIERLILDGTGIAPRQAAALQDALQAEMSRLLTDAPPVSWQQSRHLRRLTASPIRLDPPGDVLITAQRLARSIHGALTAPPAVPGGQR
jgi:hypothetical protein